MRKIVVLLGGVTFAVTRLSEWTSHSFSITTLTHSRVGLGYTAHDSGVCCASRLRKSSSKRLGYSGQDHGRRGSSGSSGSGGTAVMCACQPLRASYITSGGGRSLTYSKGSISSNSVRWSSGGDDMVCGRRCNSLQHRRSGAIRSASRGSGTTRIAMAGEGLGGDDDVITERVRLGDSDLMVSKAGIGCLNFGLDVDEGTAHRILDAAVDRHNINFIDTSEHYPLPSNPDQIHEADLILASWLKNRKREDVILSTKVIGRCDNRSWLRPWLPEGEDARLTPDQIIRSVDESLRRLKTDYIDLLQLEWGDRYVPDHGDFVYDNLKEVNDAVDFEVQLMALQELIEAGKVRHIGLCNETPYALCKFLEHAEWDDLPKIASMQVEYNLLNRNRVEMSIAEIASPKHGGVSLIAHTPLAGGALTGKYMGFTMRNGNPNYRLNKYMGFQGRYRSYASDDAVELYAEIAERYGMTCQEMAMRWVYARKHVTAGLLGATTPEQLRENVVSMLKPDLPEDVYEDITKVCMKYREPVLGPAVI